MSDSKIIELAENIWNKCIWSGKWICEKRWENYMKNMTIKCDLKICSWFSKGSSLFFTMKLTWRNLENLFMNENQYDFTIKTFITRNIIKREWVIITHSLSIMIPTQLTSIDYIINKTIINSDWKRMTQGVRIAVKRVLIQK